VSERSGPGKTDPPDQGTVGPTKLSVLAAVFVCGGLLGYALVPISEQLNGAAPRVEWTAVGALVLIAGVLLVFAYTTYRTVHRERRPMDSARAVNFLMLAKASALVGAIVAGGYLGFALQFVDSLDVPLPRERFIRSLVCAVTGVIIVVSALLLERACRVPKDDDD
jgi:hypothetical protein